MKLHLLKATKTVERMTLSYFRDINYIVSQKTSQTFSIITWRRITGF